MHERSSIRPGQRGPERVVVFQYGRILFDDADDLARDQLQVFVNPEIVATEGEAECEEGCLSVPGYYERVRRAAWVKVKAQDAQGRPFELEADGMLAVCVQHEAEHLEGKIFVDHLSPLKRQRLAARLRKRQRLAS